MRGGLFRLEMASATMIEATPSQVWDVFKLPEEWPRWSSVCLAAWDVSPELWRPGATFSFRLRMAGVGVPFSVAVTESDPPARIAWASTKALVTATRTFTFIERHGHTQVTDQKVFESPVLPLRVFYPRPLIRRMTETWLRDLKAEVERRAMATPAA